jgi:hypothetical protein
MPDVSVKPLATFGANPIVGGILQEFIATHRDEILDRARSRVSARNATIATAAELATALPSFLAQLGEALRRASSHEAVDHVEITSSAALHG